MKIRCNIHANKAAFGNWLAEYNWSTLYRSVTCEDKLDIFMKVINTGLDCFFRYKSIKLHANDKPWVTPEFEEIIVTGKKRITMGNAKVQLFTQFSKQEKEEMERSNYLDKKMDQLKSNPNSKSGGIA